MLTTRTVLTVLGGSGMLLTWLASAVPAGPMVPMEQVGPQPRSYSDKAPRSVPLRGYTQVIQVGPGAKYQSLVGALASIKDASAAKRYAILVAAGTYHESPIQMRQWVDLYGGFDPGDWKSRDVYQHAAILDAKKKSPVVIGADDARIDGFVITGGEQKAHGGGIVCDGVSPIIVNNIIVGNQTLKPPIGEGLGKQIANEGAGIALLSGSRAYVANNLICENSTEIGNGAGITCRGNVQAKILRNVFCNNVAGSKDDQMFHGKVGSRSSPGGAIACSEESSPQISFNVIVMCAAPINNDAGGIWVEGNSSPLINYNWVVGNTSGDDGGGIYCMGNLYYTDAGERYDISPDASVAVEDNLIAGNNTVRGGAGRGSRKPLWTYRSAAKRDRRQREGRRCRRGGRLPLRDGEQRHRGQWRETNSGHSQVSPHGRHHRPQIRRPWLRDGNQHERRSRQGSCAGGQRGSGRQTVECCQIQRR
jgi:hypothetical protein